MFLLKPLDITEVISKINYPSFINAIVLTSYSASSMVTLVFVYIFKLRITLSFLQNVWMRENIDLCSEIYIV